MAEVDLHQIGVHDFDNLYALNQDNKQNLSDVTSERFQELIEKSSWNVCAGRGEAFALAFDENSPYLENANFSWFKKRFSKFIYLDRICVAPSMRGKGIGKMIYGKLFQYMSQNDHSVLGIEINYDPPNPLSDLFHEKLGFKEVGRRDDVDHNKSVRYLVRLVGDGSR